MEYKKFFIIWVSLLIIVILALVIINIPKTKNKEVEKKIIIEEEIIYSNYAPDWVEKIEEAAPDNKNIEINVIEATEGRGDFIVDQERYIDVDGNIISLFYGGSYNGEIFNNIYYDTKENIKMRIWDRMNPDDGVIEGFSLFKEENDVFVIYLFVDEDWKMQSNGDINIIWGNDITDKENLHSKKFDFSNENNGIYIDKIIEDVSWFAEQNPIIGRLFFGEISLEDVKESNYDRTFIALT